MEKIKDKDSVIGVIDQGWNKKNPGGIAITEDGIEWNGSLLANVSVNGKKTTKPGNVSFKELAHYECASDKGLLEHTVTLTRTDLTNPNILEITFDFTETNAEDIAQICKVFESLAKIETVEEAIPDEKRLDYLEAFIIEDNINPIMRLLRGLIGSSFLTYKQAFAKYAVKSSWALFYKHDLPTIIGWAFSLLYRKVYVLGAIFIAIDIIFFVAVGEASGEVWGFAVMVLLMAIQSLINPFILYKRYLGILKDCSSKKFTKEQTIDLLKKKGGSNGYLAIIAGIAIIISTIAQIISFFKGDW
ncbi:MAG: hypothetical protein LBI14_01965 [Treponema sp.]|nr:hypothetical protein [Treponema sp.]